MRYKNKGQDITKYILIELLAVAFLATGGIFVRSSGISPVNCGFYRILFSLPFLYPLAKSEFKSLSKKDVILLLLAGVFFATDVGLANTAYHYTSVANVNLLSTLTPLTIVPVTFWVFKEKIPKFYLLGLIIAIVGVVILVNGKVDPLGKNYIGDMMAFLSSVFYSLFLLVSYKMRKRIGGSTILFVAGIGSVITFFVYASILEGFQLPATRKDFLLMIGLSLCMQVIGQWIFTYCQGKISVNISSVVGLIQPAFAAIYALLIFKEKLTVMEVAGIAVVTVGIFLVKIQYDTKH